ncbi:hypothetical protein PPTG_00496 [Phytophthora nicotianae INRA-310]|uniref:Uncharacterized protein n=1 Tax=Phytophthora nicotianae (strain INRA-310) TaxID=761204 RepID=W2RHI0_PHYN3|nr:hypothetical protein PPTG_00496 [Phytophthora nicotianae INRA-310]ETN24035.1 hypothetical protein PPTG_00496 [Phytophthora nicotianae INRA-310]
MEDLTAYASGAAAGGDEAAPHRADSDAPVAAPVAPREPEEEVGCSSQSAASDSEKLDDSEDEDFTPDSQASSDDEEPLTAESADSGEEDTAAEGDEDIGIYLMDQDLRGQVPPFSKLMRVGIAAWRARLSSWSCCSARCPQ